MLGKEQLKEDAVNEVLRKLAKMLKRINMLEQEDLLLAAPENIE